MKSLISIIIPAYEESERIGESLRTILRYIESEGINAELIVVDDGSTDNTREVLAGYGDRIRYVYQANRGLAGARGSFSTRPMVS